MKTPSNHLYCLAATKKQIKSRISRRLLPSLILATPLLLVPEANSAPQGGSITAGSGNIQQTGLDTTITQNTQNLAIDWDSFNVSIDEHVQFVQPSSHSIALNRINDHDGSRIHGQIDANGHVILMNPNGVFFGKNAKINVGGLVASGLNIDTSAFMNGDLVFSGIEGTSGAVINSGIINAATGGSVALLGKTVSNRGLIQAHVGHVALASGNESVVTFDDAGLIGVRINQETLSQELGGKYGVKNTGDIKVAEGKILLNASVSEDLFSQAVNHGHLDGSTQAVLHDDGSFTLGAGHSVINTGSLEADHQVIIAGNNITNKGSITSEAPLYNTDLAVTSPKSLIALQASDTIALSQTSKIEQSNAALDSSLNRISLKASEIKSNTGASIKTNHDIYLNGLTSLSIPEVSANNVTISSIGDVRQKGAMNVSNNLHLLLAGSANVALTNVENDFNTLTMDSNYVSNTRIYESNDLQLGNIKLWDSTLLIKAMGEDATISQLDNTQVDLSDAGFYLDSSNIVLGENNSTTDAYNSLVDLKFVQHIATNASLDLGGEYNFSTARIHGTNGMNSLRLTGTPQIDLNATMDDSLNIQIESMNGRSAALETLGTISQSGPITLNNVLDISLPAGGTVELTHEDNNIKAVSMSVNYVSNVNIVDKNTLRLRDMNISDSNVTLTALGENGKIEQTSNTHITGGDASLNLHASTINLGANGTSSIKLYSIGILDMYFDKQLSIDGLITLGGYFASLRAHGTNDSNHVHLGENATLNIDADFTDHLINLGDGNDTGLLYTDLSVPLLMGNGHDTLTINNASINYDWQDYNSLEDKLVILNP